jgi:6-phosphofructokinase 2
METIITLTPNPAIDICTGTAEIVPSRKLRCSAARRDPGGGGINVARVVRRLGSQVTAIYPAGGAGGSLLTTLLDREGVRSLPIRVAGETREDFAVMEESTGNQYRFVLPGASLSEPEWLACLDLLDRLDGWPPFLVASGSLPPDVPDDFYGRAARVGKRHGAKVVVDTSGRPLAAALQEGVYLVKPSLRELKELTNCALADDVQQVKACRHLIATRGAEIVALSLGAQGALLVTAGMAYSAQPPPIQPMSAVGAGDSFVGGMVWSLARGNSVVEAFRYGVAAGSAAVLNAGTELCHAADVARLVVEVKPVAVFS